MRAPRCLPARAAGFAAVLLLIALVPPDAGAAVATPTPGTGSAPKAAAARTGIKWRSILPGEAEAKKSGKPALYFFTASWCGPCHLLEEQVFAVPEVAALVEKNFVPIVVEDRMRELGRNAPEMLALADRYDLRGFPTLVISRPNLAANVMLVGWEGPRTAAEFLKTGKSRFLEGEKKSGAKK